MYATSWTLQIKMIPSYLRKVYETLLYERAFRFFTKWKLLTTMQYEFRQKCSSKVAIVAVLGTIGNENDKKMRTSLFHRPKKVFDSLDISIP